MLNLNNGGLITISWGEIFNRRGEYLGTREFEEQEVMKYLNSCALDKAPGHDEFTMGFFSEMLASCQEKCHVDTNFFYANEYFE